MTFYTHHRMNPARCYKKYIFADNKYTWCIYKPVQTHFVTINHFDDYTYQKFQVVFRKKLWEFLDCARSEKSMTLQCKLFHSAIFQKKCYIPLCQVGYRLRIHSSVWITIFMMQYIQTCWSWLFLISIVSNIMR